VYEERMISDKWLIIRIFIRVWRKNDIWQMINDTHFHTCMKKEWYLTYDAWRNTLHIITKIDCLNWRFECCSHSLHFASLIRNTYFLYLTFLWTNWAFLKNLFWCVLEDLILNALNRFLKLKRHSHSAMKHDLSFSIRSNILSAVAKAAS
jgi:hypothetical protein